MSPCGKYIATGAGDETLRFWNIQKGTKETRENNLGNFIGNIPR